MGPRVTLFVGPCANIFTQQTRFSAAGPWGCPKAAADARTSDPANNIPRRAWCAAPWRARSAKLSATRPTPPPGRLESQAGSERLRAEPAESLPTFLPRSRSGRWQIPGIPYPSHHGCEQKRGSPTATWPTSAARFALWRRSCRPLHRDHTLPQEHLRGQILGKYRRKPGKHTNLPPSPTAKPRKDRVFPRSSIRFLYGSSKPGHPGLKPPKVQPFATLG
jgi:hypothetical protein